MSGPVLHVGATVLCLHGGQVQPTVPFPRVRVGGQPVVTQPPPWVVAGCSLSGAAPCATATWVTGAVRVRAGGSPVLLTSSQAVCAPTGTGVTVVAAQPRVQGS